MYSLEDLAYRKFDIRNFAGVIAVVNERCGLFGCGLFDSAYQQHRQLVSDSKADLEPGTLTADKRDLRALVDGTLFHRASMAYDVQRAKEVSLQVYPDTAFLLNMHCSVLVS